MFSRSEKIGNRSFNDWVRASERKTSSGLPEKLVQLLRKRNQRLKTHFVPESPPGGKKGQQEGYAVKSITGMPGAANQGLVSGNAAGHNKQ
jgi:hypothetical protein